MDSTSGTIWEPPREGHGWVFVFDSYTDLDVERLHDLFHSDPTIRYLVVGKERSSEGVGILIGFVFFDEQVRLVDVEDTIGSHAEYSFLSIESTIAYCKKNGNFIELGEVPGDHHDNDDF